MCVRERIGPFRLNKGAVNELLCFAGFFGLFFFSSSGTLEINTALAHCKFLLFLFIVILTGV